jgi:hypothetical protein
MQKDALEYIRSTLYVVSLLTVIFVGFLRKILLKSGKKMDTKTYASSLGPAMGRYLSIVIVCAAIVESVAIYGLLLNIMGTDVMDLYALTLLAAAAMIYYRPRKEEAVSIVEMFRRSDSAQ